jgi:hypothetical protein
MLSVCAAAHANAIFNFDSDNLGTGSGFTDTVNGLSANFSSSAAPRGFEIFANLFFNTLTGNLHGDPGAAGVASLNLVINFRQNPAAVTPGFATADF